MFYYFEIYFYCYISNFKLEKRDQFTGKYKNLKSSIKKPFWREYYGGIQSTDPNEIYFVVCFQLKNYFFIFI